jgi:phage terminase small subunit
MAIGGRKPKPAAQKRVTGNPGKRKLPDAEPRFSGELVEPQWFSRLEREEWARVTPDLVRLEIATGVHQGALEGICVLYGLWRKARKDRDATQMRMAYDAYRKALNEFGLTPASIGRVGGKGESGDSDPAAEFFTGPRLAKGA